MDVVESSWITLIAYVLYKVQNTFFLFRKANTKKLLNLFVSMNLYSRLGKAKLLA